MQYQQSEFVANLAAALAKFQSEVENAVKNAQNPHFRNRYADLAEIINTVRPTLTKHGLSVVQLPGYNAEEGVVTVTTILLHSSGEWISGVAGAPAPKRDPQGVGSAITYLRRYALAALVGIAQEDDDGEAAVRRGKRNPEHEELLAYIKEVVQENPKLKIEIGGKEYSLAAYLKKNGENVKSILDTAREVADAIDAALQNMEGEIEDGEQDAASEEA